nr:MAG TPA: hypothetical protein [Caudoviricetes sp.]
MPKITDKEPAVRQGFSLVKLLESLPQRGLDSREE